MKNISKKLIGFVAGISAFCLLNIYAYSQSQEKDSIKRLNENRLKYIKEIYSEGGRMQPLLCKMTKEYDELHTKQSLDYLKKWQKLWKSVDSIYVILPKDYQQKADKMNIKYFLKYELGKSCKK